MARDASGEHGATPGVWMATAVIVVGSILAGVALIEWWLGPAFWIGIGLIVAGCIGGYFTNIMDMVSEYAPAAPTAELEQP